MEDIERERERERGNIPMEFEGGDRVDEGSAASGEERERSVLRWRDMRGKKIEKKKTNNATCRR
jgi:hypothetical protein